MSTFAELRKLAVTKRDNAIQKAKNDYESTIQKIAELEARLTNRPKRKKAQSEHVKLVDLIYSVLPSDKAFSVDDVLGFVRAADPERKVTKATIVTTLNRILNAGSVKRVRYSKNGRPALFAMPELEIECEQTMLDWAIQVLVDAETPMKSVEIMVAMTDKGYELQSAPSDAVRSLEREIIKSDRFEFDGERWSLR